MVYNRFVRALLFMFSMWRMARVRSSMLMGSSCASRTRSFSTSKATLAMAVGELAPLPLPPYFSRSALRLGRGIFDPSMAMIFLPRTPINRAWKSRDSLLQRKSSIRSKHSLKIEWLMPERALLKACWEHLMVSERGAPEIRRSSLKNSSSDAEMVF